MPGVDIGMMVEQENHEIGAAGPNGVVKRGRAQAVANVRVGPRVQGRTGGFQVAGADSVLQVCQQEAKESELQDRNRRTAPLLRV